MNNLFFNICGINNAADLLCVSSAFSGVNRMAGRGACTTVGDSTLPPGAHSLVHASVFWYFAS
jgi:hypothetical protein